MEGGEVNIVKISNELVVLGVNHFDEVFQKPRITNIVEIIKLVLDFSRLNYEEGNRAIYEESSFRELLVLIFKFEKDKIPDPNDQTIKFFNIIGTDLL